MSKISIKIHDDGHQYGKTVEVPADTNVGDLATEFARTRGVARGKKFTLLPKGAEDRSDALSIKDSLSTAGVQEGAEFQLLELMMIDDPDYKAPAPEPVADAPSTPVKKTTARKKTTRRKSTARKKTTRRKTTARRGARGGRARDNGHKAGASVSKTVSVTLGEGMVVWPVLVNGRENGTIERPLSEVLEQLVEGAA